MLTSNYQSQKLIDLFNHKSMFHEVAATLPTVSDIKTHKSNEFTEIVNFLLAQNFPREKMECSEISHIVCCREINSFPRK